MSKHSYYPTADAAAMMTAIAGQEPPAATSLEGRLLSALQQYPLHGSLETALAMAATAVVKHECPLWMTSYGTHIVRAMDQDELVREIEEQIDEIGGSEGAEHVFTGWLIALGLAKWFPDSRISKAFEELDEAVWLSADKLPVDRQWAEKVRATLLNETVALAWWLPD